MSVTHPRFGVWAIVSGAVQLGTAAMRRRAGNRELPMVVSGAISTAAGLAFVAGSSQDVAHLTNLAGYAVLGFDTEDEACDSMARSLLASGANRIGPRDPRAPR